MIAIGECICYDTYMECICYESHRWVHLLWYPWGSAFLWYPNLLTPPSHTSIHTPQVQDQRNLCMFLFPPLLSGILCQCFLLEVQQPSDLSGHLSERILAPCLLGVISFDVLCVCGWVGCRCMHVCVCVCVGNLDECAYMHCYLPAPIPHHVLCIKEFTACFEELTL